MPSPVETVELLAREPAGDRDEVLAVLRSTESHRSWVDAREGRWLRYLESLPKDPSDPAKDTAGTLAREQRIGAGKAKARTERAEQLGELPEAEKALEDGELTEAHVDVLTRARAKADESARAAIESHQNRLLAEARTMTPAQFRDHVAEFVKKHSNDDGRSEWEKKKARQFLRLSKDHDGMTRGQFLLAPEEGQAVRRALHGVAEELFRRDHSDHPAGEKVPWAELTQERRMAEALVELSRRGEQFGGVSRNIDRAVVVMPYDDLVGRDGPTAGTSTLKDGTPVPASVARRMACESGNVPVVLGGESVLMDYGRARRVSSPAQDQTLSLLWATCSFADCRAPIAWTQTHHLDPFNANGSRGATDLGNLTPVCRGSGRCHDLAHTPGWTFTKDPLTHETTTVAPDGRTWHRKPNGPGIKAKRPAEPPPAAAHHNQRGPDDDGPAATHFDNAA